MGIQANNGVSVPKAVLREIKKVPKEIGTVITAVTAGIVGAAVEGVGGGVVSSKHLGRRLKETYKRLLNDDETPVVLKAPMYALAPFIGATKVVLQGVSGIVSGFFNSAINVLQDSDTLKESIKENKDNLNKLNYDLNLTEGILNRYHETPEEKRARERHDEYYRARRSC